MGAEEFGRLPERCRSIAEEIHRGGWREGLRQFQAMVPTISAGLAELSRRAAARGLELDTIEINDLPLASLIKTLQSILLEVNGAVKKRDWTAVADLIEEDLVAAVEAVGAVLGELDGPR